MKTILGDINLVLSDYSGVISDDRRPVHECNRLMLAAYGHEHCSFEEAFRDERTMDDLLRSFGIKIDTYAEREALFRKHYREALKSGIVPVIYPDATYFLERLRKEGLPVAIVSAHPADNLEEELKTYGIDHLINRFYGGTTELKCEIIRQACQDFSVPEEQAVFIGDTSFDVRSAKKARVHSIAITTGYHPAGILQKEKPEILVSSLTLLLEVLGIC